MYWETAIHGKSLLNTIRITEYWIICYSHYLIFFDGDTFSALLPTLIGGTKNEKRRKSSDDDDADAD